MLTIDDQRARAALIGARAAFESGATRWGKGSYELRIKDCTLGAPQRCMVGEIGSQLGLQFPWGGGDGHPLWNSVRAWFDLHCPDCPEEFNDNEGYDAVMQFLADRIDELDRVLIEAATPVPALA